MSLQLTFRRASATSVDIVSFEDGNADMSHSASSQHNIHANKRGK